MAAVDTELIDRSSTRRQRIEDALEGITGEYAKAHGWLPGERGRHGLGWWAAQDTRPAAGHCPPAHKPWRTS